MNALILSGFLGAGKTTLLLQLAAYLTGGAPEGGAADGGQGGSAGGAPGRAPATVAILENEIGKISVDGATLTAQGIEVRELFSGCVCCTLSGELADTVRQLQQDLDPDWLIVEATGLAYPDKTAAALRESASGLERLRVLVLVDAARFLVLEKVSPLVAEQPASADVIVLNKIDLVDTSKKAAVLTRLRALNPTAPIIELVATKPLDAALLNEVL